MASRHLGTALCAALLAAVLLSGCATQPYTYGYGQPAYAAPGYSGYAARPVLGTVQQVQPLAQYGCGRGDSATGAVLGAIVGGVLGNQMGHGRGRVATTVGGAVAGGFAGNAIQDHMSDSRGYCGEAQQASIRLDDGRWLTLRQPGASLYVGERVWVGGEGAAMRATAY